MDTDDGGANHDYGDKKRTNGGEEYDQESDEYEREKNPAIGEGTAEDNKWGI